MYMQLNCRGQFVCFSDICFPAAEMRTCCDMTWTAENADETSLCVVICRRTKVLFVQPNLKPYLTQDRANTNLRRQAVYYLIGDRLGLFKENPAILTQFSWQEVGLSFLSPKPDWTLNIASYIPCFSILLSFNLSFLCLDLCFISCSFFFPINFFYLLLFLSLSTLWLTSLPPSLLSFVLLYPFILLHSIFF